MTGRLHFPPEPARAGTADWWAGRVINLAMLVLGLMAGFALGLGAA